MRATGVWKAGPGPGARAAPAPEHLRQDLVWIAQAFLDLSSKRRYLGGGFAIFPEPIETSKIREHYHQELGLRGAAGYAQFRTLIDTLDADWRDDWMRRQEERRREEEARQTRDA